MKGKSRRERREARKKGRPAGPQNPTVEKSNPAGQHKLPVEKKPDIAPQEPPLTPQSPPLPPPGSWWQGLSKTEKFLLIGVLAYLALDAVYFRWPSSFLKFCVLLMGIALAAGVTEFARKERGLFKFLLIALLAAGAAVVEIRKDKNDDRERSELLGEFQALRLDKHRKSELWALLRSVDLSKVSPRDTAKGLIDSGNGFLAKAGRLSLRAALLESRLLTNAPELATQMLAFPADPNPKAAAYQALQRSPAFTNAKAVRLAEEVEKVLTEEAGYRHLAEYFIRDTAPRYRELNAQSKSMKVDDVSQQLAEIEGRLAEQLTNFPLAGFYNHLGNLAMGQGARNRAMGYFYTGIARDAEHLPLYESISYAEWTLHHAAWAAVNYSGQGIELSKELPRRIEAEFKEATTNYAALLKLLPNLKTELARREGELESSFNTARVAVTGYAAGLRDNLELTFAYNSALELQNEALARQYAKRLYDSKPTNPEYEDTLGFVLMQFARDGSELDEAEKLFRKAENNGEEMTKQLVAVHLRNLTELRNKKANEQPRRKL